ncbi:MAG TPA: alpha/beta fold hydrolase [Solirubrobacterales bacterium]|nr:alpha/beta fold hydrolase [Solirubrobacterales bacterium]
MDAQTNLSRRHLLAGAAAAGAAGALAQVPGVAQATSPGDATRTGKRPAATFFEESALNFQMLFALGGAGYGASEVGEVLACFDRIHGKGDTLRSVFDEFQRLGRQIRKRADAERAAGRRESARLCYLRAAMYLDQALFYAYASDKPTRAHEGALYKEMEGAFASAGALFQPRWEPVRIPYYAGKMPGWFLSSGKGRRPTVILNTGSDAQNIDMYVYGGAAALERGWNALIFEGPGQGANLFLRSQVFTPDWGKVVTPVVSFLRRHPQVDKRRISLVGQSFGGYLTARAAATEHRLAGLVTDPGVHDCFVSWSDNLKQLLPVFNSGAKDEFNRIWNQDVIGKADEYERVGLAKRLEIYGNGDDTYSKLKLAQQFKLDRATARRITTPAAILSPELEQFFPGQAQTVHEWIGRDRSTLIKFTIAEGGEYHCEPMAPQLRNERVFDWLETHAKQ